MPRSEVESADLLVCVGDQTTLRLASTLLHPPSADLYTSSLSHLGSEAPRPLPIPVLLLHPDSHKEDLSQLMTNSHSKDSSQLLMTDNENETDKDLVMAALRGDLPLRKELLEVVVEMEEEETTAIALEHLVISRGATMRPLQVLVFVDEEQVALFEGDGLLVATQGSSSGYSLAAGGPLLHPGLSALVVTPLACLRSAPLVVPTSSSIAFKLSPDSNAPACVTVDGRLVSHLYKSEVVHVKLPQLPLTLVVSTGQKKTGRANDNGTG